MTVLAVIGPTALYLLFGWLLSIIAASDLSDRKGYGEKPGLASGILATVAGMVVWLFWPPRTGSLWSRHVKIVDLATAVLALALLITLFIDWYSNGENFFQGGKVYELLVPLGLAVCYGQLHMRASGRASASLGNVVVGAAVVTFLLTIIAMVTPPDGSSLEFVSYISLALSLGMTVSALLAWRTERAGGDSAATVAEARRIGAETS